MILKKYYQGLTLIELLIVISILSILSAITISLLNPALWRAKARDANRREEVVLITGALERYYSDENQYPDSSVLVPCSPLQVGGVTYLTKIPNGEDCLPENIGTTRYTYVNSSNNQRYCICADLEADDTNSESCPSISSSPTGDYCVESPF